MLEQLPEMNPPDWLTRIDDKTIKEQFPLKCVLQDSLYYPAAGFDGVPVAHLAGNFLSFVYVDYGVSREDLLEELCSRGFRGYQVMAQRKVSKDELTPNGWTPISPVRDDGDPAKYKDWIKQPFCEWLIFQRSSGFTDEHGPCRFSLLYLCADGVAAFQALYLSNRLSPSGIAIIQPGHAFGGNWTDFTDANGPLARAVIGNPSGKPNVLLYGGAGGRDFYRDPCWLEYAESLGFLGATSIGVWRRCGAAA